MKLREGTCFSEMLVPPLKAGKIIKKVVSKMKDTFV